MSAHAIFLLTLKCVGVALTLQSAEMILLRNYVSDQGVWSWDVLKDDFGGFPQAVRKLFAALLCQQGFMTLLALQFTAAILILFFQWQALALVLLLSTLLISVRFRGTFNGGSDYMTLVLLTAVCVGSFFKENDLVLKACLGYIAAHSCLSYFISGCVKLRNRHWRAGEALLPFLSISNYETPERVRKVLQHRGAARASSWLIIFFEFSFPLALASHDFCVAYVGIAILFHLACFYVFGLNRFLFAWAATYPALYFWSGRIS